MIPSIETTRFILREFRFSDLDDLFEMDSDPEVHRFLGKNPVTTKEEVEKSIEWVRSQYVDNGIGRFAIEDKATGECLGWSGLKLEKQLRDFEYHDLGYRLKRKHWGKGVATETALASLKFGFQDLNLEKINAAADLDHEASNHILKKVGLKYQGQFLYENELCNWYELFKSDWIESKEI